MFFGFFSMCYNWKVVLSFDKVAFISIKDSVISNGLSIFTKYIPGKLMVVLARAMYISKKYNQPLKTLSIISFKTQMISIWSGLLVGYLVVLNINLSLKTILPGLVFFLLFSVFLFSTQIKKAIQYLIKKVSKKNIDYPILNLHSALTVLPGFILNWVLWCGAFYFLIIAMVPYSVPCFAGFSFALAGTLAIIAIIAPGGLGVREGLLLFCLLGFGIQRQDAVTISVASRLWFLIGEAFIFILALFLNIRDKNNLLENKKGFLSTKQ